MAEKYGKITARSLWDLFMVWVVIINLCLILFDLTYLWLRPHYFRYLPIVTRIYDPVLGIEPHPLTEAHRYEKPKLLNNSRSSILAPRIWPRFCWKSRDLTTAGLHGKPV